MEQALERKRGRVLLVAADWPYERLTGVGKRTRWLKNVEYTHVGILFENVQQGEKDLIQEACGWREDDHFDVDIDEAKHVTWDYQVTKLPRFQSTTSGYYFQASKRVLWELDVDRSSLLEAAIAITRARPVNRNWYRYDAVWPIFPFRMYNVCCVGPSSQEPWPLNVPPSTCVALVLRAIAAAKEWPRTAAITSDRETFRALGIPHGGVCGSHFLTQLTPSDAIFYLDPLLKDRIDWPQSEFGWGGIEFSFSVS